MISSLFSGITALKANTLAMGVLGDNIANVNTTAFKSSRADFANLLNQSIGGFTGGEVGSGVKVSRLVPDWTQGSIGSTGRPTDLAINGTGMFVVKDSAGNEYYTRAGAFHLDKDGYLVTHDGMNVQGCDTTGANGKIYPAEDKANAMAIKIADETTRTDIQVALQLESFTGIDGDTTSPTVVSVTVDSAGEVWATYSGDTTATTISKIALASVPSYSGMAKMDRNLFRATTDAGAVSYQFAGTGNRGAIGSNALEMSNVDLATEFGKMITTQRSFQAAAKVITASDEILRQLLSMKR